MSAADAALTPAASTAAQSIDFMNMTNSPTEGMDQAAGLAAGQAAIARRADHSYAADGGVV
jgi:hypothetical protein